MRKLTCHGLVLDEAPARSGVRKLHPSHIELSLGIQGVTKQCVHILLAIDDAAAT